MKTIDISSINKKHNKLRKVEDPVKNPKISPKTNDVKPPTERDVLKKNIPKIPKKIKEEKPLIQLSDLDRSKKIKLLELYLVEFPEELQKYKNVNFNKCTDEQLIEYKNLFDKQANSSTNLEWGVKISQQALVAYEALCKIGGLDVDGVHKIGHSEQWVKNVKAVCLKYMDASMVSFVEPEHQLLFMVIQATLSVHFLNSSVKPITPKIQENSEIIQHHDKPNLDLVKKLELQDLNHQFADI